jgi:hypothetical protein
VRVVVTSDGPSLVDPQVFTAFDAVVAGDPGVAGRLDGDHLWVNVAWLREVAGGDPEWDEKFAGMLAYAASKGWVDGETVRAHVVEG